MKTNKCLPQMVAALALTLVASSGLAAATPDFWQCFDRIGGSWNFGTAPNACNVSHKMEPAAVRSEFQPVLFEDAKVGDPERSRYMGQLYPTMREFAAYYIRRRNPSVSDAEVQGFQLGLFSLAHQESVWSHYRNGTDGRVRYMRGDNGHGHGLMQVDDRAHFAQIDAGKGADFAANVVYGLDVFYDGWTRAARASCVPNPNDYYTRARAAWAAYNGGAGSICRFTNSSSKFASHDIAYKQKIDGKGWKRFVANESEASPLDVKCLAEGTRPCALGTPALPAPVLTDGLYKTSGGRHCLFEGGDFECVPSFGDVACLEAREGRTLSLIGTLSAADEARNALKDLERGALCRAGVSGLIAIGVDVKLQQTINFRTTPGGSLISQLASGSVHRTLDFAVQNGAAGKDRYYKLRVNGTDGWVYAGTKDNFGSWVIVAPATQPAPTPSTNGLAKAGETVEIVNASGINLRQTIGGNVLSVVPKGARVIVQSTTIQGANSEAYYKVTHASRTGFIYSGALLPKNTVTSWTKLTTTAPRVASAAAAPAPAQAVLARGVPYRYFRTCAATTCSYTSGYVLGEGYDNTCQNSACTARGERMEILGRKDGWIEAQTLPGGTRGWLKATDVMEFAP